MCISYMYVCMHVHINVINRCMCMYIFIYYIIIWKKYIKYLAGTIGSCQPPSHMMRIKGTNIACQRLELKQWVQIS